MKWDIHQSNMSACEVECEEKVKWGEREERKKRGDLFSASLT
jgi:hypothetical protein